MTTTLEADLDQATADSVEEIPNGWIAISNTFPRIAVMAATKIDAERALAEARSNWLADGDEG